MCHHVMFFLTMHLNIMDYSFCLKYSRFTLFVMSTALPNLSHLLDPLFHQDPSSGHNLKISNFPLGIDDVSVISTMGSMFGSGVDDVQFRKLVFYKCPSGQISIFLKFSSMNHVNSCFVYVPLFVYLLVWLLFTIVFVHNNVSGIFQSFVCTPNWQIRL